jgi:signal transduction histidine kinase
MFTNRDIKLLEDLHVAAFIIDGSKVTDATKHILGFPFFSFVPNAPLSVNVRRADVREALLQKEAFSIETPSTVYYYVVHRFEEENTLVVIEETTLQEKQNEREKVLVYHVVHEIRNALNALSLSLDLLDEPYQTKVEEGLNRLDRLSQQLMDFINLKPLERETVRLMDIATELRNEYGIKVIENADSSWYVSRQLLLLALKNLIENALEYAGSATLVLNKDYITVKDNGPGLPPIIVEKLFTPFNTTKSVGLGLYIARKACEINSLDLDYRPNVPHGSIFTISLPRAHRM